MSAGAQRPHVVDHAPRACPARAASLRARVLALELRDGGPESGISARDGGKQSAAKEKRAGEAWHAAGMHR